MEKSFVMGGDASAEATVVSAAVAYRSSHNAWLPPDALLLQLQQRIAKLTGLSPVQVQQRAEELQVIRYDALGQFKPHHDSSKFHPRLLTCLVYLNTISSEQQGGTWFPFAKSFPASTSKSSSSSSSSSNSSSSSSSSDEPFTLTTEQAVAEALSMMSSSSVAADDAFVQAPEAGTALIFFNHLRDGSLDTSAVHAGLPLLSGEKWAANYFVGPGE